MSGLYWPRLSVVENITVEIFTCFNHALLVIKLS